VDTAVELIVTGSCRLSPRLVVHGRSPWTRCRYFGTRRWPRIVHIMCLKDAREPQLTQDICPARPGCPSLEEPTELTTDQKVHHQADLPVAGAGR
jgi:hypothetical protein